MPAVYCKSCASLVGFFKDLDDAHAHYGTACPWCVRPTHQDEVERRRQSDGHRAFVEAEKDTTAFIVGPKPDGGQAPDEVYAHRERAVRHMTTFKGEV